MNQLNKKIACKCFCIASYISLLVFSLLTSPIVVNAKQVTNDVKITANKASIDINKTDADMEGDDIVDTTELVIDSEIINEGDVIDIKDVIDVDDINQQHPANDAKIEQTSGILELANGSLYSGGIKFGVIREGIGVNEWPNGDRYRGEWLNDNPHGKGFMLRKNKDEYQGSFEFGQYTGLGDLKTTSGERYLGNFRFNKLEGLGLFISVNKEYYLGEFFQQKRHGRFLYFNRLSAKPEYQIWFDDHLEKIIEADDKNNIVDNHEHEIMSQMLKRFAIIGEKRLAQRKNNTHYQIRGRVRKIVSDVDDSPEHAYGDLIINLLNLND